MCLLDVFQPTHTSLVGIANHELLFQGLLFVLAIPHALLEGGFYSGFGPFFEGVRYNCVSVFRHVCLSAFM